MILHRLYLTGNNCYIAGSKITPRGIMLHSTGANNPDLKRYVGPDDGRLGHNKYNNHWNQAAPDGLQKCPHAFIGRQADGTIATYQTLPWNHRGWHCGSGSKGSANDTHISFEICEDDLTDPVYFAAVYRESVELCVYLCALYSLTEKDIICHSEGHSRGLASNHGDVMHWFPRHGKSMDTFRTDVAAARSGNSGGGDSELYRVRKSWTDATGQLGAYRVLENAKAVADDHPGFFVFNTAGAPVYPTGARDVTYTVVKGDSLWSIAQATLGDGSRYKEIAVLNGMTSETIHAGQVLKIPK